MTDLTIGGTAPDFTLPRNGEGTVTLSKLQGKAVILYFYPKDDTSGCTAEAIDFSALGGEFEAANAVVIGISPDSVKSHDKFAAKHALSVMLAADEEKKVVEAYGVWKEKKHVWQKIHGCRTHHLPHRAGWKNRGSLEQGEGRGSRAGRS